MPPNRCSFNNMVDRWKGEHQTYNLPVDGVHSFADVGIPDDVLGQIDAYNDVTAELMKLIGKAASKGKTLRAFGSAWSLSKCGVPDNELVNTSTLTIGLRPGPTHLDAGYAGDVNLLRFVECGVAIADLNEYLHAQHLSLKASGSNSGQALAGVVSTGTHGSALKFGACQEFVVGLHLVVGKNKHVYLQSASNPVVNKTWTDKFGAELRTSDEEFYAALVSFGSFGIIHGLMVETRERFLLRSIRRFQPLDAALWNAIRGQDIDKIGMPEPFKDLYHFEIFFNPNEGTPPKQAIVMLMFEKPWDDNYTPPVWHVGSGGMSPSGLDVMSQLVPALPSAVSGLIKSSLNKEVRRKFGEYDKIGAIRDLFRGEPTRGKTLACGVGMDRANAEKALRLAFKKYKELGTILPLLLSVRYVKGTKATLGFTRFDDTCVLELDGVNIPEVRKYIKSVWAGLDEAGIPFTLHWGKYNDHLSKTRVAKMYTQAGGG